MSWSWSRSCCSNVQSEWPWVPPDLCFVSPCIRIAIKKAWRWGKRHELIDRFQSFNRHVQAHLEQLELGLSHGLGTGRKLWQHTRMSSVRARIKGDVCCEGENHYFHSIIFGCWSLERSDCDPRYSMRVTWQFHGNLERRTLSAKLGEIQREK